MKLLSLARRTRTVAHLLRHYPRLLLRLPLFVQRMFAEGPWDTLRRLRDLSDPLRIAQDYGTWLTRQHDPSPAELEGMVAWAKTLDSPPVISVVMPVFNPNPDWLDQAIQSVRHQCYSHWQLCIADDCSTNPAVRQVLEQAQLSDSRIEVVYRRENGHISNSSNSALELATGPWVALLDHDDLLAPDALAWVARTVLEQPDTQMLYSDEDKVDETGVRFAPYFKPDWNPGLIEGQNFFSHLGVYRTALLRQVGGFRVGLEGSQDYDLMLRCLDAVQGRGVVHLPRVLYHWRLHRESTASGNAAKPYVTAAAERALRDHLERSGQRGTPEVITQGYRIRRCAPDPAPALDVLLDARGCSKRALLRCLQPLLALRQPSMQVFIALTQHQHASLQANASSINQLASVVWLPVDNTRTTSDVFQILMDAGQAPWLLLWDRDLAGVEGPKDDWLGEMWSQTTAPGVVGVGPKLIDRNGLIHSAGCLLGGKQLAAPAHRGFPSRHFGYFGRAALSQDFSVLPPQALLLSRQAVMAAGGVLLETVMVPHWWVDLGLRLRAASGRLVYTPFAALRLARKARRDGDLWPGTSAELAASEQRLRHQWKAWFAIDPAYNPNLSINPVNFMLARTSRTMSWSTLTAAKSQHPAE